MTADNKPSNTLAGRVDPVIPPFDAGLYKHYKGNLYELIDVVHHSETREALVLYRALYGAQGLWVRPYDMFFEEVEIDGIRQSRFAFQGTHSAET